MYSDNNSTKRRFAGSYLVSLMSIMLVLFVLGMYAFVVVYTDRLLSYVKENIGFEVVMKSDAKESAIKSLQEELKMKEYVKSAVYISKEEATNRMKEDLGEDFLQWLGDVENPLLPSIDVRFVANYANSDSMAMVEKWLGKKTIVKEVIYQKSLTNTINSNISKIKIVLFAVSLVLLLIAITLISHTIRLSVYSKRFTVRTMQLVGATEGFVMKPFLKTFMIQGLIAAVVALILITVVLYGIQDYLPEMNLSQSNGYIMTIYLSIIALSLILTMASTVVSMKKYLNADIDRFYM
ncbi:MAG: permease-like cell division protein FtsX [Bacteroidales bacterium]|nr:permease-like cell division protein FtsX [Bacteroidales bacterium]